MDAANTSDQPVAETPSPRLSAVFGRGIYIWVGFVLVVSLNPHFLFGGWTKHEFESNSINELVPRAMMALAVIAFLWARRAIPTRQFLPAANAAIVLSLTWLLVGPHLSTAPLWSTAFNTTLGLLCTLYVYRRTMRRLAG